jgi:hypothetical protein
MFTNQNELLFFIQEFLRVFAPKEFELFRA